MVDARDGGLMLLRCDGADVAGGGGGGGSDSGASMASI